MSYLFNERIQFPVGAGFFHSSRITSVASQFTFVYDCGSVGARRGYGPQVDVSAQIDNFERETSSLSAIFVSHFHVDHVSGVPELIRRFKPGQVFIPYVDVVDRIAAYVDSLDRLNVALTVDGFADYRNLLIDPVAAVSALSEGTQVFVVSPSVEGADQDSAEREVGTGWHSTGSGPVVGTAAGAQVLTDDGGYYSIESDDPAHRWVVKLWVDPMIEKQKAQFRSALSAQFDVPSSAIETWLTSSANVELVLDGARELRRRLNKHNYNVTSMSLYSGPVGRFDRNYFRWWHGAHAFYSDDSPRATGWLATGDAKLAGKRRRQRFLGHFKGAYGHISTFAPPHHGSWLDFHTDLLSTLGPALCVIGSGGLYGHPDARVVEAIRRNRSELILVSNAAPLFREQVWAFW